MEKEYQVDFLRKERNFKPHKELKQSHGFQHIKFKAHEDSLWHMVGEILLKEVRKLKSDEDMSMLFLLERLDKPTEGCQWQQVPDESKHGLNILLYEIIRLRRKSQKQTGRVSGKQSLIKE